MAKNFPQRNEKQSSSMAWYNRPLWGSQPFLSWLQSLFGGGKKEVPDMT